MHQVRLDIFNVKRPTISLGQETFGRPCCPVTKYLSTIGQF